MADEEKQSVPEEGQKVEETQTEPAGQSDEYKAKYESLAKEIEQIKKAQSGVDRENKKLREELQQKEQGEKTLEQQLQELQQESKREKTERMRAEKLAGADLMSAYELLKLDTTSNDGMDSFIETYKNSVEAEVAKRVEAEIQKRFPGKEPPKSGESEKLTFTTAELRAMPSEDFNKLDMSKIKVVD